MATFYSNAYTRRTDGTYVAINGIQPLPANVPVIYRGTFTQVSTIADGDLVALLEIPINARIKNFTLSFDGDPTSTTAGTIDFKLGTADDADAWGTWQVTDGTAEGPTMQQILQADDWPATETLYLEYDAISVALSTASRTGTFIIEIFSN